MLALSGSVAARLGGRSGSWRFEASELVVLLLLDLAVAQAPLPSSPISSLPPGSGAGPNIAVVALLLAGALAAATAPGRPGWRWLAGAATLTAVLTVAFGTASLSLTAITGHPGASLLAARAAASAATLGGLPILTACWRLSPAAEATLLAGAALLALSLVMPTGLPVWAAVLATALTVMAATGYASAVMRRRVSLARAQPGLGVACLLSAGATVAAVLVSVLA